MTVTNGHPRRVLPAPLALVLLFLTLSVSGCMFTDDGPTHDTSASEDKSENSTTETDPGPDSEPSNNGTSDEGPSDSGPRYEGPCDHLSVTDEGGSIVIRSEFGDDGPQGESEYEDGVGYVEQWVGSEEETVAEESLDETGCVAFEGIDAGDYDVQVVIADGDYCWWHYSDKITVDDELIFLDWVLEKDCA